jgi:hypothetical protein
LNPAQALDPVFVGLTGLETLTPILGSRLGHDAAVAKLREAASQRAIRNPRGRCRTAACCGGAFALTAP